MRAPRHGQFVDELEMIHKDQDRIVSRRQALDAGLSRAALEWKLRCGRWVTVHPGVYAAQTGRLTWQQRAWAAVLLYWPAPLSHESALGRETGPIHVAVDEARHLVERPGIKLHRVRGFGERVFWNLAPPRLQYEHAVWDVAEQADELGAIAALADACRSKRTWPSRLADVLATRAKCRNRTWFEALLRDLAEGTCFFRDVEYEGLGLLVELDGRLGHDTTEERDRDFERDLDAAVDRLETVRLGYGQVMARGCSTAAKVARILKRRGWTGEFVRCPDCPPEEDCG